MDIEAIMGPLKLMSLFGVIFTFLAILAYAMWPSMQTSFDEAARLPLNED
jgi:cbb3-type cytochrome oxidase subunit 3